MENEKQYITKKEFYEVAINICALIVFTVILSGKEDEGFARLIVVLWALGLELYCVHKLRKAKMNG